MNAFFLDRMAIVDLSLGTTKYQPLPAKAVEQGDLSILSRMFDDALIFACGCLSASAAPAACVLTAYVNNQASVLTAHVASALKRANLDALILQGAAKSSSGLLIHQEKNVLISLDTHADSLCQRKALQNAVRTVFPEDPETISLITGLAAFAGSQAAALILDLGVAQKSAAVATWMAAHNLCALSFAGSKAYAFPLDQRTLSLVQPVSLTKKSLPDMLSLAYGSPVQTTMAIGRSIACHACPAPCGCFLPAKEGFVACTCPEALAALVAQGASSTRVAESMSLSERFGLDPRYLSSLAQTSDLPDTLAEILPKVSVESEEKGPTDLEQKSSLLGVCPFFLRRFPAAAKALEDLCA